MITADDVAGLISEIEMLCMASGVTADKVKEISDKLRSGIGKPKGDLAKLQAQAFNEAMVDIGDARGISLEQVREEELKKFWKDIEKIDKKIEEDFDKLFEKGLITEEERNSLKAKHDHIQTLAIDDPNRMELEKEYGHDVKAHSKKASERDKNNGGQNHQLIGDINDQLNKHSHAVAKGSERLFPAEPTPDHSHHVKPTEPVHHVNNTVNNHGISLASDTATNESLPIHVSSTKKSLF